MKMIPLMAFQWAMEQAENNKEKLETEVVVYCKIGDMEALNQCSRKEHHYQIESSFKNGTRCRVRKVSNEGKDEYFFTMKVKTKDEENPSIEANREFTIEIDKDFFEGFKAAAERALDKVRYIFNSKEVTLSFDDNGQTKEVVIPNIEYEVDVYQKEDGTTSEWCKIDIEVDNILNYIHRQHPELKDINLTVKVSHLPFKPSNSILSVTATEEQKKKIDKLWEEFTQTVK